MKSKSVYYNIKHCPNLPPNIKVKALKELRTIQRSLILRKLCSYKDYGIPNTLGGIMNWWNTPSGHDFWLKVYKLLNLPKEDC